MTSAITTATGVSVHELDYVSVYVYDHVHVYDYVQVLRT